MEGDLFCASSYAFSDEDAEIEERKRGQCNECSRPASVCLCDTFPHTPLETKGNVLILQHPFEKKRKLATALFIAKCIRNCEILIGRRFPFVKFPQLKEVTEAAKEGAVPLFVMYPGPTSEPIEDVVERLNNGGLGQGADGADGGDGGHQGQQQQQQPFSKYNLLVIDGTWQEAREMFTTIREHVLPPQVPSYRVEISIDEEFPLRTEPASGCCTTLEAVARALSVLERSPEVENALLKPLVKLVSIQKRYSPAVAMRIDGENGISYKATRQQRLGL